MAFILNLKVWEQQNSQVNVAGYVLVISYEGKCFGNVFHD